MAFIGIVLFGFFLYLLFLANSIVGSVIGGSLLAAVIIGGFKGWNSDQDKDSNTLE